MLANVSLQKKNKQKKPLSPLIKKREKKDFLFKKKMLLFKLLFLNFCNDISLRNDTKAPKL